MDNFSFYAPTYFAFGKDSEAEESESSDDVLDDLMREYKEIIKKDPKFIWGKTPHKYDLKNL